MSSKISLSIADLSIDWTNLADELDTLITKDFKKELEEVWKEDGG